MPLIKEENAKLYLPGETLKDPHHACVFFNPVMRFCRSVSSLALGASESKSVLDGLCASGARGIRYSLENKTKKVVFVDANPDALAYCRKNVKANKVKGSVLEEDFNRFCFDSEERFDFVELDPFGTPAPFLESVFSCVGNSFFFSVTATDLANLCAKNAPTLKYYGSKTLRIDCCHEIALRILVKKVVLEAEKKGFSCKPLFSFYRNHYVKTICLCKKSKKKNRDIGFLNFNPKTLERSFSKKKGKTFAGPLWVGGLQDEKFVKKMISLNEERTYADKEKISVLFESLLVEDEFKKPFFDVSVLADHYNKPVNFKIIDFVQRVKGIRVHYSPMGVKTNYSVKKIISLF
ncbi:MAG: methyltransferase [Candidatus Micrarchaeota archaeon]